MSSSPRSYECPSAQPDMDGARPFGVISGTVSETRIAFFKKEALANFDWRRSLSDEAATRVFRFAAKCEELHCTHFGGKKCSLGQRVKAQLPAVVESLPPCLIRPGCRWYGEQGGDVCLRCPQVVTRIPAVDGPLHAMASP